MSQENVAIVRRVFETIGDSRPEDLRDDVLAELFDPEVEWVPVPQGLLAGASYEGYEGIRRFALDFFAAWDELRVEPLEFRDLGDQVAVQMRMRGRMHELELDEAWSGLYTLRSGRVMRVQGFASREGALEAAGLSE
jgi:ketosteroid isomerase-like protein